MHLCAGLSIPNDQRRIVSLAMPLSLPFPRNGHETDFHYTPGMSRIHHLLPLFCLQLEANTRLLFLYFPLFLLFLYFSLFLFSLSFQLLYIFSISLFYECHLVLVLLALPNRKASLNFVF